MRPSLRSCVLLIALAFSITTLPVIGQTTPDNARRTYDAATGLLNRGLYELAATEYRSFLLEHVAHPQADEARYGLAVCLYRLGRYDEAAIELDTLSRTAAHSYGAEVAAMLGQCRLALNQPDAAVPALERVLREHADHDLADDAAALLAEALYAQGQSADVVAIVDRLAAEWPDSPRRERAELLAGLAEMTVRQDAAAVRRFADARRRWPDGMYADQTELLLAQCLDRTDSVALATKQYRRVIEHGRGAFVGEAQYGLAALLYRTGDRVDAAVLLDSMLDRFPDHDKTAAATLLRGRIALDDGQYDEAVDRFDTLIARGAGSTGDAEYWRAKCDLRRGDAAAAAARLARALDEFPGSPLAPEMLYDHGVAMLRTDQPALALESFLRFREQYPDHALAPESLHLVAAIHQQLGAYDESRAACRAFLDTYATHPRTADVVFVDAESVFLSGDRATAVELLRAFVAAHPDARQRALATYHLGLALYQLDQPDEAEPVFRSLLENGVIDEDFTPALLALGDIHFQRGEWAQAEPLLAVYLERRPDPAGTLDALLKRGLCRQRLGEPTAALAAYDELLAMDDAGPLAIHARFERGQVLLELGRPDDAANAFLAVIDSDRASPFAVHALHHLGALAFTAGAYEQAAGYYAEAAERDDTPARAADAMFQRGRALTAAGDHTAAAVVFAELLERFPDAELVPAARGHLAVALARQDEFDVALGVIDDVHASGIDTLDPDLRASVRYEQAWSLRALERTDDAKLAYRSLLDDPPGTAIVQHARLELAELESIDGEYIAAATLLRAVVSGDDPPAEPALRAEAMYRLGACEFDRGDHAAAIASLEPYLDFSDRVPQDTDLTVSAHLICGESLFHVGRFERAIAHLRALEEHATSETTLGAGLLRRGECHASLQQWSKSERAFARYLERFPDGALWFQARFGLGWALENQDRRAEAIAAYRDVVAAHPGPTAARAQFQIGECLFAERQFEPAAAALLKVDILYAYPEWSAAALYEAGRCFRELSDPVAARRHFEQVQRDHADTRWAELAARQLDELRNVSLPGHGTAKSADGDS